MDLNMYFETPLREFDRLDLCQEYQRRIAIMPLNDFFQRLLLEVGLNNCHITRDTLWPKGLNTRWHLVKYYLEGSEGWNATINDLHRIRNKTSHTDDHYPEQEELQSIRQSAPNFKEWILSSGEAYFRQSEGLSFVENYIKYAQIYCRRARDIPSLVDRQEPFQDRLSELKSIHNFTGNDLQQLILLVRDIERYDQKEFTCPKCGGRLEELFSPFGCQTEGGLPKEFNHVIACDSCDYIKSKDKL